MQSYGNIPLMKIESTENVKRAINQILHQEPVKLKFDERFTFPKFIPDNGCDTTSESDMKIDCDGSAVFKFMAQVNDFPVLIDLADACEISSSIVDIDFDSETIIVHD